MKPHLSASFGESIQSLCFDGRGDNGAEVFVCGADRHRSLDLKAEDPLCANVIEFDDKVVHGIAMALLLNGNAGDEARLTCRPVASQELREVVGDNGVFVSKACSSGQFG